MDTEKVLLALVVIERLISLIKALAKLVKALRKKSKKKPRTVNRRGWRR